MEKNKIIELYKKYAPKNISLEQFTYMVEQDPELLNDIGGKFSTFDRNLSKAFMRVGFFTPYYSATAEKARNSLQHTLWKNTDSMGARLAEIVEIYKEIICSNDDILTAAWTFKLLDEKQKQKLAVDIINALNKRFDVEEKLKIKYMDKYSYRSDFWGRVNISKDSPSFIQKFFELFFRTSVSGAYHDEKKKIVLTATDNFVEFISTLAHEYGHFIDYTFPDNGMLGTQIAYIGSNIYGTDYGRDESGEIRSPTEISSYAIEAGLKDYIPNILQEQKNKKPGLYINAMQKAIDNYKIRFKALELKEKKSRQKYTELVDKIKYQKYPNFDDLPDKQKADITKEIEEKNARVKILHRLRSRINNEYWDKYYRLLRKYEMHLARFKSEHGIEYEYSNDSR